MDSSVEKPVKWNKTCLKPGMSAQLEHLCVAANDLLMTCSLCVRPKIALSKSVLKNFEFEMKKTGQTSPKYSEVDATFATYRTFTGARNLRRVKWAQNWPISRA